MRSEDDDEVVITELDERKAENRHNLITSEIIHEAEVENNNWPAMQSTLRLIFYCPSFRTQS